MKTQLDRVKVSELKKDLIRGDYQLIAKDANVDYRVVKRVLSDYKREKILLSQTVINILQAAENIISSRNNRHKTIISKYAS